MTATGIASSESIHKHQSEVTNIPGVRNLGSVIS